MFLNILQVIVLFIGLIAIFQAVKHVVFFFKGGHSISRAMVWLLLEQTITATGTVMFSANSLIHTMMGVDPSEWNNIPPSVAIVLRTVMFTAMIHSTNRISDEIKKIQKELQDARRSS